MIDEKNTTEEADFYDALAMVPEEVRDFMWSDAFEYILDITQVTIPLSDKERTSMRRESYNLLLQLTDMEQVTKKMLAEGIAPEKITKILYVIHTQILSAAKKIVDNTDTSGENEALQESAPGDAPETASPFATLNRTLTAPTNLAPTKREYTSKPPAVPTPDTPKPPAIDPYRELPER